MLSLEDKFYGLSIRSWLIISILVLMFYLFVFTGESTPVSSSNSNPVEEKLQKEKFSNSENKKSNLVKVYNFNTSWCGYSVRFQPEWEKFQKEVKARNDLSNVKAYDIKCDNADNKQMCADYEVPGFPTVIIEKDGQKIDYNGPRTAESIIETLKNL
jgi:thiol-disulfide isomerase/thioredoxin